MDFKGLALYWSKNEFQAPLVVTLTAEIGAWEMRLRLAVWAFRSS